MAKRAVSYGRQTIEEDDIRAVEAALRSEMLTQGPLSAAFEEAITACTGAKYAVVCSNGTAALHIAMLAAGVGKGDEVVTSPMTFLASANSAVYAGAKPVFADVDENTANISPAEIERALRYHPSLKAIVPVHYSGLPAEMEEIKKISAKNGLIVIEDACHALGASWQDSKGVWHRVGGCSHSDMTVFSFHPVKSITTGEGGAVTTNDPKLYERLKALRSHGVVKGAPFVKDTSPWYYEMQELGFNYRLTDIQCALGISQIKKLESFIGKREEAARRYTNILSKYPFIKTPSRPPGKKSAWHLYPVRIAFDNINATRKGLFEKMRAIGINLQVHYIPVHLQPYYKRNFGFKEGDFPRAERFYSEEVSLPIYPTLTEEEAGAVTEGLISTLAYEQLHKAI